MKMEDEEMRRLTSWFGMASVLPFLVTAAHAGDVELGDVPQVIMETIKARFPEVKVAGAAKEKTQDGKEIYEISLEDEVQNTIDVTVTPEGAITLIEKQIGRKDLPAVVAKTVEDKYPKSRYRLVEEVIEVKDKEEKLTSYEVLLVTPKKELWSVTLDLEGKIVLEEEKTDEEEE